MKKIFGIFLLTLLVSGCQNNQTSETISVTTESESETISQEPELVSVKYRNPVYDSDFADPSYVRCEEDGYYYVFATGAKIIKSADLVNYEFVGNAFTQNPSWGTKGAGLWAPDVQYINGQYVMYYSLSVWDDPNPGIGIATAPHPAGPWTDQGKLFTSNEIGVNNSIDAMVFEDETGIYMVWGSFRGIYIVEMTEDGLGLKNGLDYAKENKILIAGYQTNRPLDVSTYEGAYIVKKDDYYYLFLSSGQCCGGAYSYNLRVARSTSITGPYVDKAGNDVLGGDKGVSVITSSSKFQAVGHNSVLQDDNGDYWTLYHGYKIILNEETYESTIDTKSGRVLLMDPLDFKDGWPSVLGGISSSNLKSGPLLYQMVQTNI